MLLGLGKTITFGQKKIYPYATGGDYVYLYEEGNKTYRVHEFLTAGATATLNVEVGGSMDVLVVGGGGGGGAVRSGGGGAGGFVEQTFQSESDTSYSVYVGNGGRGGDRVTYGAGVGDNGLDGENSRIGDIEALGGAGAIFDTSTQTSGKGSGAGGSPNRISGGIGATGQGNDGGDGWNDANISYRRGGGGGGAGQDGFDATQNKGGTGGAGKEWPIGSGRYFSGGGGGAGGEFNPGGIGGGGTGANNGVADSGQPNTGGGGGGIMTTAIAGSGGSGIVIVRYVVAEKKLWTPSELTSLKAWWDAESLSLSNDSAVSTWSDSSGNGYSLNASGSSQPIYKTNVINGLPVVQFDGTDDYLEASTASDWTFLHSSKSSIFSVVKSDYDGTLARAGLINTTTGSTTPGFVWVHEDGNLGLSSMQNYVLVTNGSAGQYPMRNKSPVGSWPSGNIVIASLLTDPANITTADRSKNWINGDNLHTGNVDTSTPSSSDPPFPLRLGKNDFSSSVYLDGWFGELVICDDLISDTDRQKLEGYLAHKWGLTNNLPSGHPYKYEPPYKVEPEEIVTDGLVLNLDAGDYASYPRSGTTWYDISGNGNNGTLTNGPTYDSANKGSIVFDGVDDYVILNNTPSSLQGNPSFSVEGWFKKNGDWFGGASWGIGGNSNLQGINSYINSTDQSEISIDLWGTSTYTTNVQYSSTEWKHIVWTYNGQGFTTSNIIIYINGVPYTGNDLETKRGGSGTPNINSSGIVLGRAGTTTNNYYGKPIIANFRIYSKVLSSTEITQNFNALKGRYGL